MVFGGIPFKCNNVTEESPCGRYVRYAELLGTGGFKSVYKGLDKKRNVEIAWNQIHLEEEDLLNSAESQENLCSEAVLLNSLNHRRIMKCYAHWIDTQKEIVNMITELFPSGTLNQHIRNKIQGNNIDLSTIKNWARQILEGLLYLHSHNPPIVHRDIKCDNIFVTGNGKELKIGDFGLAITMERGPLRTLAGTCGFMAPECYDEKYNELVDIYAFGMCLLEIVTGKLPYSECRNSEEIIERVMSEIKPVDLDEVKDVKVKALIEKCLAPASERVSAEMLLRDPFFKDLKGRVSGPPLLPSLPFPNPLPCNACSEDFLIPNCLLSPRHLLCVGFFNFLFESVIDFVSFCFNSNEKP